MLPFTVWLLPNDDGWSPGAEENRLRCRHFKSSMQTLRTSMQSCAHTLKNCVRATAIYAAAPRCRTLIERRDSPTQHRFYASVSAAELQFGQPLRETHPHLLKPGERTWCPLRSPKKSCLRHICSHARHHRTRIRPAPFQARLQAPKEWHCCSSCLRSPIQIWRCFP